MLALGQMMAAGTSCIWLADLFYESSTLQQLDVRTQSRLTTG
jgi:hypothetical protein